jgi:hypothetical protein
MPNFSMNPYGSPHEDTPLHRRQQTGFPAEPHRKTKSSLRYTCQSPDDSYMHAWVYKNNQYCIESTRLSDDDRPGLIRTRLPDYLQQAMLIEPPIELVCIEGEPDKADHMTENVHLLHVCVYTQSSVFIMHLVYKRRDKEYGSNDDCVQGEVAAVVEPFERMLMDSDYNTRIIRIRSAPQSRQDYATMCPGKSLAMLTYSRARQTYAFSLYHAKGKVTTPLEFQLEEAAEDDPFVDFCFVSSNGLSLFSSLGIALLKEFGDVHVASPIVFEGTVVQSSAVSEALDYVAESLTSLDRSSSYWRKLRVAQQYILDTFPLDNKSRICTATFTRDSALWPVQIQGPVLFGDSLNTEGDACTIEKFGKAELVGVAIGRSLGNLEFAIISPTSLVPQFAIERRTGSFGMDDSMTAPGAWVESLQLFSNADEEDEGQAVKDIRLISDPVSDRIMHFCTRNAVCSISTNAIHASSRLVLSEGNEAIQSSAWLSLSAASEDNNIQGIVVSRGSGSGHSLVARLTDGTVTSCNVLETQYAYEMNTMLSKALAKDNKPPMNSATSKAMQIVENNEPFYKVIEPHVKRVHAGLSSLGKIVGSQTMGKDITPDLLAATLNVQNRNNKISLALTEMILVVEERKKQLKLMIESQHEQLETLMSTIDELKSRNTSLCDRMSVVEVNALSLQERSVNAYQASQDLCPTISNAEYEFFGFLKRMVLKTSTWEKEMQSFVRTTTDSCSRLKENGLSSSFAEDIASNPEYVKHVHTILNAQKAVIEQTRQHLQHAEQNTGAALRQTGLEVDNSENISSNLF